MSVDPDPGASPVILVIDGGSASDDGIVAGLSAEGFCLVLAATGEEGIRRCASEPPDAILVSAELPDLSCGAVLRLLHEAGAGPILVLSRSDDEGEAVLALEMGAVDVLNRPDRVRETAARIWSALRMPSVPFGNVSPFRAGGVPRPELVSAGPVEVDLGRREVRVRGRAVDARPMDFALLELLVGEAGHSVSRGRILRLLWPGDADAAAKRLDVHIRRLRSLVEEDASKPRHIITLRGYGHRFDP